MREEHNNEINPFDKNELSKTLDRVNYWISNCDTKISFALAFAGVLLAVFFSSNVINGSLKELVDLLNVKDVWSLITIGLVFVFFLCLLSAIVFFIIGLKSSINLNKYKQQGLTTNSLLHFGAIKSMPFNEYKDAIQRCTDANLKNDYLSQIYINSLICKKKFKRYNIGIYFLVTSVILFVLLNLTFLNQ